MHLKLFVLSASSFVLWLVPLTALDKTLGVNKALQGVSLGAAIACAVTAGNIAREQTEQNEIEEIKTRAITADVVDEIATSAYISQQQRQQEAEQILSGQPEREEAVKALKRAWLLDFNEPSEPVAEPLNQPHDNALTVDEERFTNLNLTKNQAIELIQKLRTELNQTQTIEKLWECKKGGSEAWKRAYAQFKNLMEEGG
jgi:MFS superfamily sulfate permease-like transporter